MDISNPLALGTPKLNISDTGMIPTITQIFSVSLPCSGVVVAEVNIVLTVNITSPNSNVTSLTFRRKKICRKIESLSNTHVLVDNISYNSNSVNIFYIAVGCAGFLIATLAFCVVVSYVKGKKDRRDPSDNQAHMTYVTNAARNPNSTSSYGSFRRMPSYSLIDERSKDLQERIAELTIQRYDFVILRQEGRLTNVLKLMF